MGYWQRLKAAYQTFRGEPVFSGFGGQGFWNDSNAHRLEGMLRLFTGSKIDYEREVGDLSLSSLVMAAANWLGTTLPEAPLEVVQGKGRAKKPPLKVIRYRRCGRIRIRITPASRSGRRLGFPGSLTAMSTC